MLRPFTLLLRGLMSVSLVGIAATVWAQQPAKGVWLDRPAPDNWNKPGATIPRAPRGSGGLTSNTRCSDSTRRPENAVDSIAAAAGWKLYGPVQSYSGTVVINAMSDVDGMCRPLGYQTFVFVKGKYAGSLSPSPMDSRTDGSSVNVRLISPTQLFAEYSRYADADALCCPSRQSTVNYRIDTTPRGAVVVPSSVDTTSNKVSRLKRRTGHRDLASSR